MQVQNYAKLKTSGASPQAVFTAIHDDAVLLAGELDDMTTRSVVYHHLYVSSGGNFMFPLIAAHGALWARWYLFLAKFAAWIFAAIDVSGGTWFRAKMRAYQAYVDQFKDINRQVMQETYKIFHMTALYGPHELVTADMPPRLCRNFIACHKFAVTGTAMPPQQQREFYEDFFRWEQINVVGPAVDEAVANFDWPLMKWFCQRPWVWFSYFRLGRALRFKNFSNAEERTQKGLAAFDWGTRSGWPAIEDNLTRNPFFPRKFSFDANIYFQDLPFRPLTGTRAK